MTIVRKYLVPESANEDISWPITGALVAPDVSPLIAQHFLDLFEELLPEDYFGPMRDNAEAGYEVFQALAEIGARLSTAVFRFERGSFIIFAEGGVKAEVPVQFTRTDTTYGITVKAGTIVSTSRHGRRFVLSQDVAMGIGVSISVTVTAIAEAYGYEWSVPGPVTTAGSELLEGDIDTIDKLVCDPAGYGITVAVQQAGDPTTNGKSDELDGLASNRDVDRSEGEDDVQLRARARTLPDTVSPAAIRRTLERLLGQRGLPYDFIESFEHRYQECWDAPSPNSGTPTYAATPPLNPDYDDTVFVYDDPRTGVFANRWLDELEYRGAFFVLVSKSVTLTDVGMAYDDPATLYAELTSPTRGTPAYDVPSTMDPSVVNASAYDGWDIERAGVYAGLYDTLQKIKAGGVAAIIVTENS